MLLQIAIVSLQLITIGFLSLDGPSEPVPGRESPAPALTEQVYLCSSQMQLRFNSFCQELGPAADLETFSRQGLYPQKPLQTIPLNESLDDFPFRYKRMPDEGIDIYYSVEAAWQNGEGANRLARGSTFISYEACYPGEDGSVYMIDPGVYVRRGPGCSGLAYSTFHGVAFEETPPNSFGWSVDNIPVFRTAGDSSSQTAEKLYRYDQVMIYDHQQVGVREWAMIGIDRWVWADRVAEIVPDPIPPAGVTATRWIVVNLMEKTFAAYEQGELVFATLVSVGAEGSWTRPGLFQVYAKLDADDMSGAFTSDRSDYYFYEDVPWVMYFDEGRALHGVYWHNSLGAPITHGCVNLALIDARFVFDWVEEGTWVHVVDPSGLIPVDLSFYTSYERDRGSN